MIVKIGWPTNLDFIIQITLAPKPKEEGGLETIETKS